MNDEYPWDTEINLYPTPSSRFLAALKPLKFKYRTNEHSLLYQKDPWEAHYGERDALEARLQMKPVQDVTRRESYDGPVFFDTAFTHQSHESNEEAYSLMHTFKHELERRGYDVEAQPPSVRHEQRVWDWRCVSDPVESVPAIRGVMRDMVESVRATVPRYSRPIREFTYPYGQRGERELSLS